MFFGYTDSFYEKYFFNKYITLSLDRFNLKYPNFHIYSVIYVMRNLNIVYVLNESITRESLFIDSLLLSIFFLYLLLFLKPYHLYPQFLQQN